MKKVIFFDIDGTIVTEDERALIPESTVRAIKKARENGNYTFINTGRTIFNVQDRIKNLGFDGFLCGCGTYIECNGEEILYHTMPSDICHEIVELVRECKAIPLYERRDNVFFDSELQSNEQLEMFRNGFLKLGFDVTLSINEPDFHFDKFVVWCDETTNAELFKEKASKYFSVIDRENGLFENVPLGYSKATAIDVILKRLGIELKNAYAIGDSTNDLPMLEAVPNSIAMGGGKAIHSYVSFITKDIEDDGIEFALKHFNII